MLDEIVKSDDEPRPLMTPKRSSHRNGARHGIRVLRLQTVRLRQVEHLLGFHGNGLMTIWGVPYMLYNIHIYIYTHIYIYIYIWGSPKMDQNGWLMNHGKHTWGSPKMVG